MNELELKSKMIKLWKSTFHDSDSYISLIFDNYFDPDLIEYQEESGQLISALLGIPYEFGNGKNKLRALYLCGLATTDEFRNRGIMNNLLENINKKAVDKGYSFTFLIPANDDLINYYSRRKYETSIYRVEDRYTELHEFDTDYLSSIENEDERVIQLKRKVFEFTTADFFDISDSDGRKEIIDFIYKHEHKITSYITLLHSRKDIDLVISDNEISKGKIIIARNRNNISGVAFIIFDERKRIHVQKAYYDDQGALFRMLDFIKKKYAESPISVYNYPEECNRRTLFEKVYGATFTEGAMTESVYGMAERVYDVSYHAKPYGMMRILDFREILKFIAADRSDSKFSVVIKNNEEDKESLRCDINNGRATFSSVAPDQLHALVARSNISVLNEREFMEITFRKKGSSNLIQEAFDIPRIPINMALLLD